MKKRKRYLALIMSIIMIFSLSVSSYADIASGSNAEKIGVSSAVIEAKKAAASPSNANKASSSNADLASPSNIASYSNMVRTGQDQKLQGTLDKGTTVYREPNLSSASMAIPFSLDVTVVEHYYNEEEVEEEWYEIRYDNFIVNLISYILDYHFVLAGDINIELEETKITAEDIINTFDELEFEYESLSGEWEECRLFYDKMMDAYSLAFEDDELIIDAADLEVIDEKFAAMENALKEDYDFTICYDYPIIYYDDDGNEIYYSGESDENTDDFENEEISLIDDVNGSNYSLRNSARTLLNTASLNGIEEAGAENDTDKVDNESVETHKSVSYDEDEKQYTLTLESFVTGILTNVKKPSDIVVVLDQSASMYVPVGSIGNLTNKTLYDSTANKNVKRLANTDLAKYKDQVSQLGYFVAQSRTGGHAYCESDCKDNDSCKTYDWFVVKYDSSKEKPWQFYRVTGTSKPAQESEKIVQYADISAMGANHFWFYYTQYGALYDSLTSFADQLEASGVNHRMAVVGFSTDLENREYTNGSGIYIGDQYIEYEHDVPTNADGTGYETDDKRKVSRGDITSQTYNASNPQKALDVYKNCDISDNEFASALVDVSGIGKAIDAVRTDFYNTNQYLGMYMANRIFEEAPASAPGDNAAVGRSRAVILFTDGKPSSAHFDDEKGEVEAETIRQANIAKKEYDAEVYTICTSTISDDAAEFLIKASSDYDAEGKQVNETYKYYQKTTNASGLSAAFDKVVNNVSSTTSTLDEETILQDVISGDFVIPEGGKISVFTADAQGWDDSAGDWSWTSESDFTAEITQTKNPDTGETTVTVTNFDYAENYVSKVPRGDDDFYGKKLIVEIPIVPSDTNPGGNSQATNVQDKSGIYYDKTMVEQFDVPRVDVPTKITIQKIIEGGPKAEFAFESSFSHFDSYVESTTITSGNYLEADESVISAEKGKFSLQHDKTQEFTGVYVGDSFKIKELDNERYDVIVTVKSAETEQEQTLQADANGYYCIEKVEPNTEITFTNKIKTLDLTIQKTGADMTLDPNQTFIFHIKGNPEDLFTKDVDTKIVIEGNGSATIKDLWCGDYTVTEENAWSWRYNVKENGVTYTGGSVNQNGEGYTVAVTKPGDIITFTNEREKKTWLDANAWCQNMFRNGVLEVTEGSDWSEPDRNDNTKLEDE